MRVLFLTPGLGLGGAEWWILTLCKHFQRVDVAGIYACTRSYHRIMVSEARRLGIPLLVPTEEVQFDAVITWGNDAVRQVIGEFAGPVIEVAHNSPELKEVPPYLDRMCEQVTHYAAVSASAARGYPPEYRDRVRVIENGADPDRLVPLHTPEFYRERWDLRPDSKIVLQMGRMTRNKRPDRLISACSHLPDNWVPVICGEGPELSISVEMAKQSGRKMIFCGATPDIGGLLQIADVVCLPSESEGMPLVPLEAWLAGTPVVTTPFPAMKDLHDRWGKVVCLVSENPQPEELAAAIVSASHTVDVQHAFNVASENYTAEVMTRRWEDFLLEVGSKVTPEPEYCHV